MLQKNFCNSSTHFNDTLMSCKNTRVIQSNNSVYNTLRYAKTADSFPGVVLSLNSNVSSNKPLSANVSILLIAALFGSGLLWPNRNKPP